VSTSSGTGAPGGRQVPNERKRRSGVSQTRAFRLFFALILVSGAAKAVTPEKTPTPAPLPGVLAEIDRIVRQGFWDPKLKGLDWAGAVSRASGEIQRARTAMEKDDAYDRLLARLDDSHTFRLGPGRLPARDWGTAGLRIGQDETGYAVKGLLPGSPAERAGLKLGDRVLAIDGKKYGSERVNFRDLFLVFEGPVGSTIRVTYAPAGQGERTVTLTRTLEEPGDALVWKSARALRHEGKTYGYVHLWGFSSQTALALVDLLLDREEVAGARKELAGWGSVEGLLLDIRGNSGGYDPNILASFLLGCWTRGDYYLITREGRRLVPPEYRPLPTALLIDSGTASQGEVLAIQFRRHKIGPIVGEPTSGMASGGASAETLSDGSQLWMSRRAVEDIDGRSYEGHGVPPDIAAPDRPAAGAEGEDAVVEAAIRALAARKP
jgi:C-terminal processing protease CtpA/Prc